MRPSRGVKLTPRYTGPASYLHRPRHSMPLLTPLSSAAFLSPPPLLRQSSLFCASFVRLPTHQFELSIALRHNPIWFCHARIQNS